MTRSKTIKRKIPGQGGQGTAGDAAPSGSARKRRDSTRRWSTSHLAGALVVGLAVGLAIGFSIKTSRESETLASVATTSATPVTVPSQAPTFQPASAPQTALDAYGRPPSDPHYGHDHP